MEHHHRWWKRVLDFPLSPVGWYLRTGLEALLLVMLVAHMVFHPVVSYSLPQALTGEAWIPVWRQMQMIDQLRMMWKKNNPEEPFPLEELHVELHKE